MTRFKEFWAGVMILCAGLAIGGFFVGMDVIIKEQKAYIEGRNSVLGKTVTVGREGSACLMTIPVSVLAEMVNMGALDWHERCAALEE